MRIPLSSLELPIEINNGEIRLYVNEVGPLGRAFLISVWCKLLSTRDFVWAIDNPYYPEIAEETSIDEAEIEKLLTAAHNHKLLDIHKEADDHYIVIKSKFLEHRLVGTIITKRKQLQRAK